jgi:V/A-type H+-transporting ATPase subunit A
MDALSAPDRLTLEAARSIREDFLHQDAFHEVDTYTPLQKQYQMMKMVLSYYDFSNDALQKGAWIDDLVKLPVREQIGRFKYLPVDKADEEFSAIECELSKEIADILAKKEEA